MFPTELAPFASKLGLEIGEQTTERVLARLKIKKELCNRANAASGGLIMAVADVLAGELTIANLPKGADATTIDSSTNFIARIPEGETANFQCDLIYNEKKLMVLETGITRADGRSLS